MDSKRNCTSVKCKCGHRQLFNKNDVIESNDERYIYCEKCGKEIRLKRK